jgi:hypothetical protein
MVKPVDRVYYGGRIYKKGERMENKVKRADGIMKRLMMRLPLAPKSSPGPWPGSGLLRYPHWGVGEFDSIF